MTMPRLCHGITAHRRAVQVTVALRSSKLLRLYNKLGKYNQRLDIAQVKAKGEVTKKVGSLVKTVDLITSEIEELKTAPGAAQDIVCAFVTFDRWEDCEKALRLYSGMATGWLCIDHRFRWKVDEEDQAAGKKGMCYSKWGNRLRVQRAPEPQNIVWENFGVSDAAVIVRRTMTALLPLILLAASAAAFVLPGKIDVGAEVACTSPVCDVNLQWGFESVERVCNSVNITGCELSTVSGPQGTAALGL